MAFVRIPFTTDSTQLADTAVQKLVDAWPGYEPNDADMEVVQIETLATMAQASVESATTVPDAIFRGYGQSLLGVIYLTGARAVGTATFTAIDAAGYNSLTSVEIAIAGVAFTTDAPVIIPPTGTTVDVAITCSVVGVIGNGLSGVADVLTGVSWVDSVLISAPTTAGSEDETDVEYQNRLADILQLSGTTLVTGRDFELMAIYQPEIGRALCLVGTQRVVDVYVTDVNGEPCTTTVKDNLEALYEVYRQVNTVYNVHDPQYATIAVTYTVQAQPGYDPVALKAQVSQAVTNWLLPANWGRPADALETSGTWQNDNLVRYTELIRVLSVPGVRYVSAATLNGGTADINMADPVCLTRPGTITGTVTGP